MSETTTHTPGPWHVEDRRSAPLKNIRVVAGQGEVAQVQDVHQRDYLGGFDESKEAHAAADVIDAIGLANARLIAAAPAMLSAMLGKWQHTDDHGRTFYCCCPRFDRLLVDSTDDPDERHATCCADGRKAIRLALGQE